MENLKELSDLMLIDHWQKVVMEIKERLLNMDRFRQYLKKIIKDQAD